MQRILFNYIPMFIRTNENIQNFPNTNLIKTAISPHRQTRPTIEINITL